MDTQKFATGDAPVQLLASEWARIDLATRTLFPADDRGRTRVLENGAKPQELHRGSANALRSLLGPIRQKL